MQRTISLLGFIKDEFVPEPKEIPERIVKKVILECEDEYCPFCGEKLVYHYLSNERPLITLEYDLLLRVVHKKCVNRECIAHTQKRNFYNRTFDLYILPKKKFSLDVILLIGYLINQNNFTEEKVVTYLLEEHGIVISQPSVNNYKRIALAIGESLILGNAEKIRKGLDKLPYRIYSIDGLSSNKSTTLFIIRDLISGTVLGSALLDGHDAETFHTFMESIFQKFGEPDIMIGDGEKGLIGCLRKYYSHIDYQYCQRHFLNNLGKALMEELYKAAKKNSIEKAP